jgi:hypothetical protein
MSQQYDRKTSSSFDETQRLPTSFIILLVALVILLIVGGLGLAYLAYVGQMKANTQATATTSAGFATATARTNSHLTAIAAATGTSQANANATGTAQANSAATAIAAMTATAQVNANATATASVIAANPDPYPPGGGMLTLLDPLHDNNLGNNWTTTGTNCAFTGNAYHVIAPDIHFFASCFATSTNFSNFVYEVQMQIIKGDIGGIIFRADSVNKKFYLFYVTQTGNYELLLCPSNTCHPIVQSAASPAIHMGLNSINTVAVQAIGNSITLFVNNKQVASVIDSTFNHGQIGLAASAFATNGHPTEVVYSNAKVWVV